MKKTDFNIEISLDNVLRGMCVFEDNELYEEIRDELITLIPIAKEKIKPVALLEAGTLGEHKIVRNDHTYTDVLYVVTSIGKEMERWSTQMFAEGDCLKGMLINAMSDDFLFQMDSELESTVIEFCKNHKKGIVGRAEIPKDMPMDVQRLAYDTVHAEKYGIEIKESFMYNPVKTLCSIYLLDDNAKRFKPEHDCSICDNITCKKRKFDTVLLSVHMGDEERIIHVKKSESVLNALQRHNIFLPAICAGRGICGKCKVRVLDGIVDAVDAEKEYFTGEELEAGWRLACCLRLTSNCTIEIENKEDEIYVVSESKGETEKKSLEDAKELAIAVDIGTTTIAMQLIDQVSGGVVETFTTINKQRAFGADVISRIDASNNGKKQALRKSIQNDLLEGYQTLTKNGSVHINKMNIGANSTMVHLLMGYSCETLGVFPFKPYNIGTIKINSKSLLSEEIEEFQVEILPGVSTYVGGDITSGMYALGFQKNKEVSVLIDLGTNGEMAIGNADKIYVTSTAAGPAFEGGNIVCGTGSIPGAICNVEINDQEIALKTIGDAKPLGICGTGVLECIYELLKNEYIEESGLMEEDYFDDGFMLSEANNIRFYQKDVREIQLAKAAVRAGLETLILRYGVTYDEIDHIYISGGFGYKIDIQKAIQIGLFPEECSEKIEAIGNSCLKGVVQSLKDKDGIKTCEIIVDKSEEISLSTDKYFQAQYVEHMLFERR